MNPSQALARSRMGGPLGIPDRQWDVAYPVLGFGGSMWLSRPLATSGRLSRPTSVAIPVAAATVVALVVGMSHQSSFELIVGSFAGSLLGVIL